MKKIILTFFSLLLFFSVFGQFRSDSIHIAHYDLNLAIDPYAHTISGTATLAVVPRMANLTVLHLDLAALTVDSVKINGVGANFAQSGELLSIQSSNYQLGDTLSVAVTYHGTPVTTNWGGVNFTNDGYCFNLGVNMNNSPHCYGRAWYPCIDEFADKSTYDFHIATYPYHKAICGGELLGSSEGDLGMTVWHWRLDKPVPTYLTSVATGNYSLYTDTFQGMAANIPITIYAPASYFSKVATSFANLKTIANIYESHYGPLQFDRIGYVLVNFNGGAMEHATNIAYPQSAVNGNTAYEELFAHEFAHSWFGNLVTCERAEEMWINEGLASYATATYIENLYSREDYDEHINELHFDVLNNIAKNDGGYYALNDIPQNHTYGTHTYDKGELIAHTLRHYMGDSLFFAGLKAYLQQYAFQCANSEQFFAAMTQNSGINLTDFYEAFVNQPGFLHFSIDSIIPEGGNQYAVYIRQRLSHAQHFANGNLINLTFFNSQNQRFDVRHFAFSGQYGVAYLEIPFEPIFGVVDFSNEICDAVIDYNSTISTSGTRNFTQAKVSCKTNNVSEPVQMRVECNLVHADPFKQQPQQHYRVHNRYWRIEYTRSNQIGGKFTFSYNGTNSSSPEYELLQGVTPSDLALLYRRNAADDWHFVTVTRSGNLSGTLTTDSLRPGEYTFAVPGEDVGIRQETNEIQSNTALQVYPNPTQNQLTILCQDVVNQVNIFDLEARQVASFTLNQNEGSINLHHLSAGTYLLTVLTSEGQQYSTKFVKQ